MFCHLRSNCLGALEDPVVLVCHSQGSSHGPACMPKMIPRMPKCTHATCMRTIHTHLHTCVAGNARLRRHTNGCMHIHQETCTYARSTHEQMHTSSSTHEYVCAVGRPSHFPTREIALGPGSGIHVWSLSLRLVSIMNSSDVHYECTGDIGMYIHPHSVLAHSLSENVLCADKVDASSHRTWLWTRT